MPTRWSTSRPNMSRDASVTGVIVLTTATICSRVAVREFRTQSEECFECLSLCVHSDMLSTRDIGLDDPHQRCSPPAAFRPLVRTWGSFSRHDRHQQQSTEQPAPSTHIRPRRPDIGRDQVLIGAHYPCQLFQLPEPFHIAIKQIAFPNCAPPSRHRPESSSAAIRHWRHLKRVKRTPAKDYGSLSSPPA
jgi:hypothetical protein